MTISRILKKLHRVFEICPAGKTNLFRVELYEKVSELPQAFHSFLNRQPNIFLSPAYLGTVEESRPMNLHFLYAAVSKGGQPAAFMYFQLLDLQLNEAESFLNPMFYGKELEGISKGSNNIFLKSIFSKPVHILFCGNVFVSGDHGIFVKPDVGADDWQDSFPVLLQKVIDSVATDRKIIAVIAKDFYDDKINSISSLEKHGYQKVYFDPNMVMPIRSEWRNFDDYLDALSSKYRVRAKNVLKRAEGIKVKELSVGEIKKHEGRIAELYMNVHKKAAVHFSAVNVNYFLGLKDQFGDRFVFKGFFIGEKMIAFSSLLTWDGQGEAHLVGIDYDFNKLNALYPFILYQYISDAIRLKISNIYFGRTALEIKSTVGALAKPIYCYVGIQSPLSIKTLSPFFSSSVQKEIILRDPFKEVLHEPKLMENPSKQ